MARRLAGVLHTGVVGRVNRQFDIAMNEDGSHFDELNAMINEELAEALPGDSVLVHASVVEAPAPL